MIRSIFPLPGLDTEETKAREDSFIEIEDPTQVIGFKLAKKADDVQSIQIYLTKVDDESDDHQLYQLYMLLESALPRYSKLFNARKSLA